MTTETHPEVDPQEEAQATTQNETAEAAAEDEDFEDFDFEDVEVIESKVFA